MAVAVVVAVVVVPLRLWPESFHARCGKDCTLGEPALACSDSDMDLSNRILLA